MVSYANRLTRTETDGMGQEVDREIPFLKAYTAFNVEQIEDLPAHFHRTVTPPIEPEQRIDRLRMQRDILEEAALIFGSAAP